jgi:NAD(P)-dependent dehydrogenase (short-subunit alcohol dehydrogenase family)
MNTNLFDLTGRVAIITGGLGQLGQRFALALATYGAKVCLVDICDYRIGKSNLIDEAIEKGWVFSFKADVTDKESLEKIAKRIEQEIGSISILINNAAIDAPPGAAASENVPFEDYSLDSLYKMIDVNIVGTFICCQVFGKMMASNGIGSIINISSIYGLLSPNQTIYEYKRKNGEKWFKPVGYSVTKSAILNFTRYLATYWATSGVRVNTLSPAGIFNNQDEEFLKAYCSHIPIARMADANELNGAIVFLSSDASSYMTGANLVIDGGWTAW